MGRNLFDPKASSNVSLTSASQRNIADDRVSVQRGRRPSELIQAHRATDISSNLDTSEVVQSVAGAWAQFIADNAASGSTMPLGIVSQCYLGLPFVVHYLDLLGNIVEHFPNNGVMPSPFEEARKLALHPAYEFVKVYKNVMVLVREDGSTTIVNKEGM